MNVQTTTQISRSLSEDNGHLSKSTPLPKGCPQGDAMSPCIFTYCAEILSQSIRVCGDIKGIEVSGTETIPKQIKLGLQGTGVCLFPAGTVRTMYVHCTYIVPTVRTIVHCTYSARWVEVKYGMDLTSNFVILGIKYDVKNMDDETLTFINKKISVIGEILELRQPLKLTTTGTVTVIKFLFLSKITYLLRFLPLYLAKIHDKIPNFFSFKHLLGEYYTQAKFSATIIIKKDISK